MSLSQCNCILLREPKFVMIDGGGDGVITMMIVMVVVVIMGADKC